MKKNHFRTDNSEGYDTDQLALLNALWDAAGEIDDERLDEKILREFDSGRLYPHGPHGIHGTECPVCALPGSLVDALLTR